MSAQNKDQKKTIVGKENLNSGETVEVLYQKLGNRWYAFSMVDDDVFVGAIDDEQLKNVNGIELRKIPEGA